MREYPQPTILCEGADWLRNRDHNYFSQFGEDGLIEAVFDRIGMHNRWCFEVGASDGETLSNTKVLRDDGWDAVLIEAEPHQFEKLRRFESERVRCVNEHIGPASLDRILRNHSAPRAPDFGSLDIDGQDYWAWAGMVDYVPRVMLVEYAIGTGDFIPPVGGEGQAKFDPIVALGRSKGYAPVIATYVNVLFVWSTDWESS